MCSDLYKPLKNKQLNKITKYYKFDLENSVNKPLLFKNFSGWPPGPPPPVKPYTFIYKMSMVKPTVSFKCLHITTVLATPLFI